MNTRLFAKHEIIGDPIDFLNGVCDVTVIVSIGSCISDERRGHFRTIMFYNDRIKLFEDNIETNSANVCILQGMLSAIRYIKKPTSIYLVSGAPLGFHSGKSPNRSLCEQIYLEVVQKSCTAEIIEIPGKAEELKLFVNTKLLLANKNNT